MSSVVKRSVFTETFGKEVINSFLLTRISQESFSQFSHSGDGVHMVTITRLDQLCITTLQRLAYSNKFLALVIALQVA